MRASILICTKDRPELLEYCVKSIVESIGAYDYSELVIVDDSTKEHANRNLLTAQSYGAKYIQGEHKGLAAARNLGLKHCCGDIVVFIDDDCIADKYWLTNLLNNYEDNNVGCCTGRIVSLKDDPLSMLLERLASPDRGTAKMIFDENSIKPSLSLVKLISRIGSTRLKDTTPFPWGLGYGANSSVRLSLLKRIGGFNEDIKRGEELDLFYAILKAGYKAVYEPKAVVYHLHDQTQTELVQFFYLGGLANGSFILRHIDDPYMVCCFIGYFFYLLTSIMSNLSRLRLMDSRMLSIQFQGFLMSLWHRIIKRGEF